MRHVLIAEPDWDINHLLQQIIIRLGWTFDAVYTGTEALELVQRVRPDLVIAEADLPGLRGIDLLRRMKSDPDLAHISVVITSTLMREGEAEAMDAGCDIYLPKPFPLGIEELQVVLSSLMGEGRSS